MKKDGMINGGEYQYDESLTNETMLSILEELFPERSVYSRTTIWGSFACVKINKFNCIMCKVKADKQKTKTFVTCGNENTLLGNLFLGGLVGYFLSKNKGVEIMELIYAELNRRYISISEF